MENLRKLAEEQAKRIIPIAVHGKCYSESEIIELGLKID
jgi:hypothetical protein